MLRNALKSISSESSISAELEQELMQTDGNRLVSCYYVILGSRQGVDCTTTLGPRWVVLLYTFGRTKGCSANIFYSAGIG